MMDVLQSWWQVPAVAYFCSVFQEVFDLVQFDIEELESGLLECTDSFTSPLIANLLVRLLRGCYRRCDIESDNYEPFLRDIVKYRWHTEDGCQLLLESDDETFGCLSLRDRVDVLHAICHYRLTADDVTAVLEDINGDSLRLQPVGRDSSGATFWYFYGTRLYKETVEPCFKYQSVMKHIANHCSSNSKSPATGRKVTKVCRRYPRLNTKRHRKRASNKTTSGASLQTVNRASGQEIHSSVAVGSRKRTNGRSKKSVNPYRGDAKLSRTWHIICSTYGEWESLVETFTSSDVKCEKDLARLLKRNFLPTVKSLFEEQKKKQLVEARRRSSRKSLPNRSIIEEKATKTPHERLRRCHEFRKVDDSFRNFFDSEAEFDKMKLKEERSRRAQEREKRLSQLAANVEPEQQPSVSLCPDLLSIELSRLSDSQSAVLLDVLQLVKDHRCAEPFMDAVDEQFAPCYYDIIKNPICLSKMETKLERGDYKTLKTVLSDFQLMADNCTTYNGPESGYTSMAHQLHSYFFKLLARYSAQLKDCVAIYKHFEDDRVIDEPKLSPHTMSNNCAKNASDNVEPIASLDSTGTNTRGSESTEPKQRSFLPKTTLVTSLSTAATICVSDGSETDDDTSEYSIDTSPAGTDHSSNSSCQSASEMKRETFLHCRPKSTADVVELSLRDDDIKTVLYSNNSALSGTSSVQSSPCSEGLSPMQSINVVEEPACNSTSPMSGICSRQDSRISVVNISSDESSLHVDDKLFRNPMHASDSTVNGNHLATGHDECCSLDKVQSADRHGPMHTASSGSFVSPLPADNHRCSSSSSFLIPDRQPISPSTPKHKPTAFHGACLPRSQKSSNDCENTYVTGTPTKPNGTAPDAQNKGIEALPVHPHRQIRPSISAADLNRLLFPSDPTRYDGRSGPHVASVWRPEDTSCVSSSSCNRAFPVRSSAHDSLAPAVISHVSYSSQCNDILRTNGGGVRFQKQNGSRAFTATLPRASAFPQAWSDVSSQFGLRQVANGGLPVIKHQAGILLSDADLRHHMAINPRGHHLDSLPYARPYMTSPLALHSPQSLSPIIPPPVQAAISPLVPLRRLSINIPRSPPPENGCRGQQPLGGGLLTTRPSLVLVAQPLVNCYTPLHTPILGPAPALHWTCANVANFGPRIPFL